MIYYLEISKGFFGRNRKFCDFFEGFGLDLFFQLFRLSVSPGEAVGVIASWVRGRGILKQVLQRLARGAR